ncbi:hypothetical protein [Sphingomonas sp. AX6]|uniref:hypothetical protein n=1 Tax=Sphingomonas sp. AX6 TaxID=2653171 RepID=UPI00135A22ED|nr:hypothetical protein [Sphingomonas sp. AX6]
MPDEAVIAVGFLTQHDLTVLGRGFQRYMPVDHDDVFADLVDRLDQIEVSPLGRGVTLMPKS